jgi:nucleotide-binding universal stress UspA family protein
MTIKDILVAMDRSPGSGPRLDWTLRLAGPFSARVTALALVAEPYLPPLVGVHIPVELLQQQVAEAEREADAVLAAAREAARTSNAPFAAARMTASVERLPSLFARAAGQADLCVVGKPSADHPDLDATSLAEAAFLHSGRPALVLPAVGTGSGGIRRAVVAWNGSREAARAVHDALPLLAGADRTLVVAVDETAQRDPDGRATATDLAAHLARHGVRAEATSVPSGGLAVGDVLLSLSADMSADLLVMGGYGHSRMRELVLGGATRHLLAHATLPVLLSH